MAQKLTTSARIGTGSINNNNRKFIAKNVDESRTNQNIIFVQDDIKKAYHKLFDDALQEYNAKQTRKDRVISDYYEHIRLSKRLKLYHEVVFQLGDKDFQKNNPNLYVFNATLHMDEATPHLHIDFIPVANKQKLGLHKKVSLKSALAEQGFRSRDRKHTEWQVWCDNQKKVLGNIAISHGFEVEHKDVSKAHLNCDEYREQCQLIDKTKEEVMYYQGCVENLKDETVKFEQNLENLRYQGEVAKSDIAKSEIKINANNDYISKLQDEIQSLMDKKSKLEQQIFQLTDENFKLIENNKNNLTQISQLQTKDLLSQIEKLENEKTKILNPTQIDEFILTKKLFGGVAIKSNNNGNVGMYLQQLVNMAKDYENMQNCFSNALDEKEKAVSERDIALKELEQIKENAWKSEFNTVTKAKIQANNERNQLNLLRKVCNIPKDIDTY